jgi:hypothetical protein
MSRLDRSKGIRNSSLHMLLEGVRAHYAATPDAPVTIAGRTMTAAELLALIQADIDASGASVHAYATWLTRVQEERESHRAIAPVLRALTASVLSRVGDTVDVGRELASFGLAPRKLPARTAEAKAAAAEKGKATRAARGTMGKKERLAIKGTVPAGQTPKPERS